ncbi:VOC family protein [Nannocystaceae bacterium ST9]
MLYALRTRMIALGFHTWSRSLRARRVLRSLGRPRIGGLDHLTIPVHDLDVARRFYCEVLGAVHMMTIDAEALERFGRPPAEREGEGTFHVSLFLSGSTRIDLFWQREGQPRPTVGHPHLAFRVPAGQLLGWRERLHAAGVPTEGPLQLGFPGQASLYFNDPSGNHLELVSYGFGEPLPIRPPRLEGLTPPPTP